MSNLKDFDSWNGQKKNLHSSAKKLFCNTREVWWIYLGLNIGFEQDGKNGDFVRPVLILRKFNNEVFLGLPLSTKTKPGNRFYVYFERNGQTFATVISQVRLFDVRRLKRKMYRLDELQFSKIRQAVVDMVAEEEK